VCVCVCVCTHHSQHGQEDDPGQVGVRRVSAGVDVRVPLLVQLQHAQAGDHVHEGGVCVDRGGHEGISIMEEEEEEEEDARLTKLEVGVVGTDVVAGAQQAFHHQRRAHGVVQPKVLGDATLLSGGRGAKIRRDSGRA